jgi:hypothetical protein
VKTRNKILISLSVVILFFLISVTGTGLYLYHHPALFKPFLEKTLSRTAGAEFTLQTLSYSLRPLSFRAAGIRLEPGEKLKGLSLEIPALEADMSLEGPFGRRRLILKTLRASGFSCTLSRGLTLPEVPEGPAGPSLLSKVLKGFTALFLFRDVTFHALEAAEGRISAHFAGQEIEAEGIRATLNRDRLVEITCRARARWPARNMEIALPHVRFTTDRALSIVDPEIRGRVIARAVTLQGPALAIPAMDCEADLTYDRDRAVLSFAPLSLEIKGAVLKQVSSEPLPPLDLRVNSEGSLDLRNLGAGLSSFHLIVGDILDASGRLHVDLGARPEAALALATCRLLPEKLLPFVPSETRKTLAPWTLGGPLSLQGKIKAAMIEGGLYPELDLSMGLNRNPFSYRDERVQVGGDLSAEIRISGGIPDVKIRAKLDTTDTLFSAKGFKAGPLTASLTLSYERPLIEIGRIDLHIPRATVGTGKRTAALEDIRLLSPKGTYDLEKGALDISEAALDTSILKNLVLSLRADKGRRSLALRGKDVRLIETARAFDILPSGWRFKGSDALEAKADQDGKGDWSVNARLDLRNLALENRDSSCVGENLALTAEITGKTALADAALGAGARLSVHGGELLVDRFYLDLGKNGLSSSFEGRYGLARESLEISRLFIGLKDILNLDVEGSLHPQAPGRRTLLDLRIPETPLNPLFRHFVLDPFKAERPFLTAMTLEGNLSADLELRGLEGEWNARGHCRWLGGRVSLGEGGAALQGIDLELPLWYRNRPGGPAGETLKGRVSIRSMALPPLPEQSIALTLRGGANRLSWADPTTLKVPGGEVRLGPVVIEDLFSPRASIRTSLAMEAVDLDPLLARIWSRSVGGTIRGRLDPIRIQGDTLNSRGEIRAEVFGGDIVISDLGASGLSTAAPLLRLNAGWNDLRLADLTRDTSFGRVEGIMTGHLNNLEIAYGQPQRFDLLMETEERKGIPQRISVRAVDNIARLGGGQSPFMGLAGILSSFFRQFPYKKIGVHASLENDVFRINGTVKEDGAEYLVKRGSFSGVNVVNQNPDNRINFKDMVKRIKRITASKGGPVVR